MDREKRTMKVSRSVPADAAVEEANELDAMEGHRVTEIRVDDGVAEIFYTDTYVPEQEEESRPWWKIW